MPISLLLSAQAAVAARPGCIAITGQLRVQFKSATDLAGNLFKLSQAMANDWGTIERALPILSS